MKQRIYNGHSLEFYNEDNSKKGELRISGSDIVINPIDDEGTIIFGEDGSINDIEVGASGTAVDFTFLGGGAITSDGGTLTLGKAGDTVDLSNATIGTVTASIFKGGVFLGDGSGLTDVPSTFTHITASGQILAGTHVSASTFIAQTHITASGNISASGNIIGTWTGNPITEDYIGADAITAAKIGDNVLNSEHYAAASIDNEHLADNAVGTAEIANDAVTYVKMQNLGTANRVLGATSTGVIGETQIVVAMMAANSVDSDQYVDASIDNAHLANDAVGADELASNAVVNASVAANAAIVFTKLENLDSTKMLVGNGSNKATEVAISGDITINNTGVVAIGATKVVNAMIGDGAVDTEELAADSVTAAKIGDNVINSEHYAAASIDNEHLADNAVDTDEIADDAVTAAKLAANAVVNASITSNAAIAHTKLAALAATKLLVGNGSNVPTAVVLSGDVTMDNAGAVTIANTAVTNAMIGDGAVDTEEIANDAVTAAKLASNAVVNASITANAAIAHSKLAALASTKVLVGNGSNVATEVALSGDVTMANNGAVTIGATKVVNGMLADGAVDTEELAADSVTAAKIGDNVINSEHYAAASIDNEHLADNAVDTAEIAANAVTLAKMAGITRGSVIVGDASGDPAELTIGNDGTVLKSDGTDITWGAAGVSNALTVDNATLQLNSGTTFDGTAARTISIKNGGVDSDALAASIAVTSLTATDITVDSLTVTALTSSVVTSSILLTEGSNIFGDADSDSHRFTGSLSVSDDIVANNPGGTSRIGVGENQNFDFNHLIMESDGANNKTDFYTTGTGNHMEISTKNVADIILSSNKNLYFKTDNNTTLGGGTTRMFITGSSGNVGIGTTSPGEELEVIGNISASGVIKSVQSVVEVNANSVIPLLINNKDGEKSLDVTIDGNQHTELEIFKDGVGKLIFQTYWSSKIDNDSYESRGALILGNDVSTTGNVGYGLYISAGPNSGSIYAPGLISGSTIHMTSDISALGNISSGGHVTASGNISASGNIIGTWAGIPIATAYIADDAINADKIGDNVINSEHYAAASIDNEHLADNAVGTAEIANNAVTLAKMAGIARGKFIVGDSSGDPSVLAAGADGKLLVADANGDPSWTTVSGDVTISAGVVTVGATKIVNGMLADGAVDTEELAADSVTAAKIGDNVINSEHYAAASIDNEHLADNAVGTAEIANDAVTADKLAANAVVNASVAASAAIVFTKLENLDSTKMLVGNGSNKATEVAISGDVTMANTGAVTIGNGKILNAMLEDGAVDTEELAADSVTAAKIGDNVINSEHYAAASIDNEHLADNAVGTDEIAADAVTYAKIQNVSATNRILGRDSSGAGAIEEITPANLLTMLGVEASATADQSASEILTLIEGEVNTEHITNSAVETNQINDNAVTLAKLAGIARGKIIIGNSSGDPAVLAAGANGKLLVADANGDLTWTTVSGDLTLSAGALTIGATKVVNGMLADGAVDTEELAADSVTAAKIGDNVINSEHYAAASIDNEHLADNAVDTDEIANDAVTAAKLASNAVVNASITANAAIAHSKLAAIAATKLLVGNGSNVPVAVALSGDVTMTNAGVVAIGATKVVNSMIGDGAVDTEELAADSVTAAKIGDNVINSEHYAAASIDNEHLADNAVGTAEIANNAVTLAKMAGIARGKIIIGDSSGDPAVLAAGANGKLLVADANGDLSWTALSGDATLSAGAITLAAAQTNITSLLATDIKIGEDDQTKIDFEIANEIHFYANNAEQVYVSDGVLGPQTDSDVDLGTDGVRFKDAYVDSVTCTGTIAANKIEAAGLVSHLGDANTGLQFSSDTVIIEGNNLNIATFNTSQISLHLPTKRTFAVSSGTDGNANGDIVYFGNTTSMTTGALYHYKNNGTWELADADSSVTCDGLLGIALGAASNTNGVLLRGMVTLDHDPGAVGDVLYVSTGAGNISATAPSGTNDIVRVIGYCLHASAGNIWFNPDNTFIKHA